MRLYDQASQQGRCAWVWMGTMLYSITLSSLVWCKARGPNGTFSDTDAVLAPAIEKAKHSRPMLELVHSHLQNLEVPRARLVPPIVITATRPAKERVDHLIRLLRLCHFKCHGLTALYKDFCNDTDSTLLWVALSSCGLGDFRELRSLSGALYHVERPQEEAAERKTDHLDTQELLARTQDFADSMEDFWNALPAAEPDSILQLLESIRHKTQYWEWFSDLPAIQPLSPDL
jgi:hypothetical protein